MNTRHISTAVSNSLHIPTLILGGGISAIAFAHFYEKDDYLIIEQSDRLGGLCKSFQVGDSVFDYSGHFIHFKDPAMEKYVIDLITKHATGEFKKYDRVAGIAMLYDGKVERIIDYPFQANIHELEYTDFIRCLVDLYTASKTPVSVVPTNQSFFDLVQNTFGAAITNLFFRPYNEKLYQTPLEEMSADAMKRFIPKVLFDEVINNFIKPATFGYNGTFMYSPTSGVQGLVDAFLKEKNVNASLNETVLAIDTANKIVTTDTRTITYETLINTLPLDTLTKLTGRKSMHLKSVDVHVYNITFQEKASHGEQFCWLYFPGKVPFYRVGFYNYMSGKKDTSVYVEVSMKHGSKDTPPTMDEIIKSLMNAGVIFGGAPVKDTQKLVISPAYVILEKNTESRISQYQAELRKLDVYLTGRYSKWSYQSIEDNLLDAKKLAHVISTR